MGAYYRFPRTTNEARQYYCVMAFEQELGITIPVRSKRHAKVLPDLYNNDYNLMRWRMRSWKCTRKTQWRTKK